MSKRMSYVLSLIFSLNTFCLISIAEDHLIPETDPTQFDARQAFQTNQLEASSAFIELCRQKLEKAMKHPNAIRKAAKEKPAVCFAKTRGNRAKRISPIVKVGKNAFRARAYIKFQGCLQGILPKELKKKDIVCVDEKDSKDYTQGRLKNTMACLFRAVGMRASVEDEFNLYGLLREGPPPKEPTTLHSCQANSVIREDREVDIFPAAWTSESKIFSESKVLEQLCERGFGPEVLEASNLSCTTRKITPERTIASME